MDILTVDFETYYDTDYSLRKMTTIEYIMDARFQPIMMSYAINDEPVKTAVGYPAIKKVLDSIDWNNTILNAQNTMFDGTIIHQRFKHKARYYTDTMAMARVTGAHVVAGGASLEKIGNLLISLGYPIPPKGDAVKSASGLHLYETYDPDKAYLAERPITDKNSVEMQQARQLLEKYIEYCENDVELARQAFKYFSTLISPEEMQFGDMILKCYIEPQFLLDLETIQDEIGRIEQRDIDFISELALRHFGGDIRKLSETCRSAPKFTAFLESLGGVVDPKKPHRFVIPTKYSEKKDRVEPCYSKSYSGMMEMLEHEDPDIADLFKLKLLMTSSIEMSRAKRFESIAKLGVGFGMPYTVGGAHTLRLGGSDKLNVQNLSSGRRAGQSNALKRSIIAPEGYTTITYDSSQIELRTGAYMSGDDNTLNMFTQGQDPYSVQASLIYGGDPTEIKKLAKAGVEPYASLQRPVGKSSLLSCIYGTGAGGFQNYLKVNGIDLDIEDCKNIVQVYRQTHPEVVAMWKQCENALNAMVAGGTGYFGGRDGRMFYYDGSRQIHGKTVAGIRMPDGNWLNYYGLRWVQRDMPDGSVKPNLAYYGMKERKPQWIYTYPAKFFENLNQSFAFAVMKYQAMLINQRYRIAGNTHDEWFITVPESEAQQASDYMQWCMRQVPVWATGLPVDCEGSSARRYGDCK